MNLRNVFISLLFIGISGCASTPQTRSLLQDPGTLPVRHEIVDVPFIEQTENYCGPASLAMIASWAGLSITPEQLGPMMFTPEKKGTFQTDYLGAARRIGLIAINVHTLRETLTELSHDHPVAVLQNLGSSANPIWHYAVLLGYDLSSEELVLHSGKNKNFRMNLSQFERTWQNADHWGLIILPPNILPETSTLDEDLVAAGSLERVKKNQEANVSYQTILSKWPTSVGALFGLGNTFYSLKKYSRSALAFEKALTLAPQSKEIENNLREVKLKLKKHN